MPSLGQARWPAPTAADVRTNPTNFFGPCIWATLRPSRDSRSDDNLNLINMAKKIKKYLKKKSGSDNYAEFLMVGVAQLVEHQVVALVAAGSIPVTHPIKILKAAVRLLFLLVK